jgi:hypothetical protein
MEQRKLVLSYCSTTIILAFVYCADAKYFDAARPSQVEPILYDTHHFTARQYKEKNFKF